MSSNIKVRHLHYLNIMVFECFLHLDIPTLTRVPTGFKAGAVGLSTARREPAFQACLQGVFSQHKCVRGTWYVFSCRGVGV